MCELIATCVESHPNPKRAYLSNVKSITCKKEKEKQRLMNPRFFHGFYFVSVRDGCAMWVWWMQS